MEGIWKKLNEISRNQNEFCRAAATRSQITNFRKIILRERHNSCRIVQSLWQLTLY
jgi:hypothetical protein